MSIGENFMKNILKLVGLAMFTLSTSQFATAESVTLKFHTFVPMPANSNAKFVKPWAIKWPTNPMEKSK